jgi:hypothetical protein
VRADEWKPSWGNPLPKIHVKPPKLPSEDEIVGNIKECFERKSQYAWIN